MSCEFCNGKGNVDLDKVKTDAKRYVKEQGKPVVVYRDGQEYKFMEAQAFYEKPAGEPVDRISLV